MDVDTLLHQLKAKFGEPTPFEGQDAFRWEIEPPGEPAHLASIHLCLTLERQTQKAAIWVFDPRQNGSGHARYFHIQREHDITEALDILQRTLCPSTSTRAPVPAGADQLAGLNQ